MQYRLFAPALRHSVSRAQKLPIRACQQGVRQLSSIKSPRPFEEEKSRNYNPKDFYPAHIGDTLHGGKYELVSKLGWGSGSTVWLARASHW